MELKKEVYKILRHVSEIKTHLSGEINSRVLIYHHLKPEQAEPFAVQLEILTNVFDEMVTASEFITLYLSGKLHQKRYCCITFDDGFESAYTIAKSILDRFGIAATIFLSQSFYDLGSLPDKVARDEFILRKFPRLAKSDMNLQSISRDQVLDFIHSGYEIGGHTYSHTSVSAMKQNGFYRELTKQKEFFEREFNYSIKSFAYPYGRSSDIPNWGAQILKKAGYASGFTGISQSTASSELNIYEFPRTSVSLGLSEKGFVNLLRGSQDFLDKITLQNRS